MRVSLRALRLDALPEIVEREAVAKMTEASNG
jgi:hypothetical protein